MSQSTNADADGSEYVPLKDSVWGLDEEKRNNALERCVLPLTSKGHKGTSGRIAILGGSAKYTGAPYYASMAGLKVGSDLATVFCAEEASIPIKCYSPELMVAPAYKAAEFNKYVENGETESDEAGAAVQKMVDTVSEMLDSGRLHAMVIGPGLGRCPLVLEATSQIIRKAISQEVPLVIDGDGLFILTLDEYDDVLSSSFSSNTKNDESALKSLVVLTPNAMEQKRLKGKEKHWDDSRVIVVEKGQEDVIFSMRGSEDLDSPSNDHQLTCSEIGGLKRSGGMGDILAGTLGTFMAWNSILKSSSSSSTTSNTEQANDDLLACWMACTLVKRATHEAYHIHHRSMTAPDVLDALGPTFHDMTQLCGDCDEDKKTQH